MERSVGTAFSTEFEQLCEHQCGLLSYILGRKVETDFYARTPESFFANELRFIRIPQKPFTGYDDLDKKGWLELDKSPVDPEVALRRTPVTSYRPALLRWPSLLHWPSLQ